jgi:uncharacterized protein
MNLRRALQARLMQSTKPADFANKRWLSWLGHRLHDPNLWHFGRRSVSKAAGIGFLVAFFPIPIHMLIVVPLAVLCGINLPVLIAAMWITNPITWVPAFYFAYRVGVAFTGESVRALDTLHLSADWGSLQHALGEIWLPLFLGSAICGVVFGALGYLTVEAVWRYSVGRRWRARIAQRRAARI